MLVLSRDGRREHARLTERAAPLKRPSVAGRLPRLAYVFNDWFGTWAVAQAAAAVCELVWVVDSSDGEVGSTIRVLRHLGTVVDVAGMAVDEAAAAIAACTPDGIMTEFDGALVWTAQMAQRLGLAFISVEVARRLTDKYLQRVALRDAGLPVPGFWRVAELGDGPAWAALARDAVFPAVLKPRRGWGSRDTVVVQSLNELYSAVAEISATREADDAEMILEEYLRDRPASGGAGFASYVSVESVVSGRRITHVAITGRMPLVEPLREGGAFIPSALEADDRQAVGEVATAALTAVGIQVGCVHTEIKLTPDGARVIEVNGRIGGSVPELLATVTGVELLPIAMRVALGHDIIFDAIPTPTGVAYILNIYGPPGMRRVTAIDGIDRLREQPQIRQVILDRGPGCDADWREGRSGSVVVTVTGSVADHEQLRQIARLVDTHLRIYGE